MAIFVWHGYKTCYHLPIEARKSDLKHVAGHCSAEKVFTPFAALYHFISSKVFMSHLMR